MVCGAWPWWVIMVKALSRCLETAWKCWYCDWNNTPSHFGMSPTKVPTPPKGHRWRNWIHTLSSQAKAMAWQFPGPPSQWLLEGPYLLALGSAAFLLVPHQTESTKLTAHMAKRLSFKTTKESFRSKVSKAIFLIFQNMFYHINSLEANKMWCCQSSFHDLRDDLKIFV